MRFNHLRAVLAVAVLSIVVIAATTSSAYAKSSKISGKVAKSSGYQLMLVRNDGSAVQKAIGASGKFSFKGSKSQLKGATLHLIRPSGAYYGPIVLRWSKQTKKANMMLAGMTVALGTIKRHGNYARVKSAAAPASLTTNTIVTTSAGAPKGSGKHGFVRAKRFFRSRDTDQVAHAAALTGKALGGDYDTDGVVNAYDVDDDGDLILDSADTEFSGAPSRSHRYGMFTNLKVDLRDSINRNAMTPTAAEVDDLIEDNLALTFLEEYHKTSFLSKLTSADVDCFSLTYCKSGAGTAVFLQEELPTGISAGDTWTSYDPNSDTLPNMWTTSRGLEAIVAPKASMSNIAIGDAYAIHSKVGSRSIIDPVTLTFYFVTTPALKSITSGGTTSTVSYPVSPSADGTRNHAFNLTSTTVTLSVYPPQRPTVSGAETGDYRDMGGLYWNLELQPEGGGSMVRCESSDFSSLSSTLEANSSTTGPLAPLHDTSADAEPSASHAIEFTVDFNACFTRAGVSPSGKTFMMDIEALDENSDNAAQHVQIEFA